MLLPLGGSLTETTVLYCTTAEECLCLFSTAAVTANRQPTMKLMSDSGQMPLWKNNRNVSVK